MTTLRYYWEDLQPGPARDLGTITVNAQEIKEFAAKFDPQPFHLDEEAGRQSIFGNLIASGWHKLWRCRGYLRRHPANTTRQPISLPPPLAW